MAAKARHCQRGQTIPVWAFGSLSLMVLLAVVVNYGNALAWQFRAQNAADAAARGVLSVQTNQWNQTIATLHAAAVEEYRIRYLLNDMDQLTHGNGGCNGAGGKTDCNTIYTNVYYQFLDAVNRYTNDAIILNRVSAPTQATQIAQMRALLTQMQTNCGSANGLDCGFNYTLVAATPRSRYIEDVYNDASEAVVGGGTSGSPKTDLSPLQVEVVACANVSNIFPSFSWQRGAGFTAPNFQAIGRAAATSVMTTQEFMYVGSIVNPTTGSVFQPTEYPETTDGTPAFASGDPFYRIDYGGNPNSTNGNTGNPATSSSSGQFIVSITQPGLVAFAGWWNAMPIRAFSGALTSGTNFTCK